MFIKTDLSVIKMPIFESYKNNRQVLASPNYYII
jgi:hypothetical protein